jgi:hypothetical protein
MHACTRLIKYYLEHGPVAGTTLNEVGGIELNVKETMDLTADHSTANAKFVITLFTGEVIEGTTTYEFTSSSPVFNGVFHGHGDTQVRGTVYSWSEEDPLNDPFVKVLDGYSW